MKRRTSNELFVYMNNERVGTLNRKHNGLLTFEYHLEWLQSEKARHLSLTMPLQESAFEGEIVYHFFDNLLPDNRQIRERIQTRFGISSNTCFDILSYIGSDCVGALQLLTKPEPFDIQKIEATPLDNKTIANILKGYVTAPLGMQKNTDFRISIAGAQEKTALLWYHQKWHLPKRTTPTTHIIKLPIGYIQHANIDLSDSVENEWLCLKILDAFGLPVNQASMVHFEEVKTLVVERFDRTLSTDKSWIIRLPQEDMCQALGQSSALKYESDGGPGISQIMSILKGSENTKQDREIFMKTVFLFWVLGATDGHAKNFSIVLKAKGRYQLTPIYDVISAYPIVAKGQLQFQKLKMAMALNGKNRHYKWNELQKRYWLNTAKLCQFPEESMELIMSEVFDNMDSIIEKVSKEVPADFPSFISQPIFEGMRKIKVQFS